MAIAAFRMGSTLPSSVGMLLAQTVVQRSGKVAQASRGRLGRWLSFGAMPMGFRKRTPSQGSR